MAFRIGAKIGFVIAHPVDIDIDDDDRGRRVARDGLYRQPIDVAVAQRANQRRAETAFDFGNAFVHSSFER